MDLIAHLAGYLSTFVYSIIPFLLVLTVIVFVHEYGHFQVARWCGVAVDTFAVGFGREIVGVTDRHGTRWKFCWIPIGGYVKFEDDANATSHPSDGAQSEANDSPTAFHNKSLPKRAAVVAAGPIANFLLAIAIYSVVFASYGQPVGAPVANEVVQGGAADVAGIKAGDRIIEIDGNRVNSFSDIQYSVWNNLGDPLNITIDRNGETVKVVVTPLKEDTESVTGDKVKQRQLGIKSGAIEFRDVGMGESVILGAEKTWVIAVTTLNYVRGILIGRETVEQLQGPVGIARTTGYVAKEGVNALFQLAALLSVSIGLINLFPIPMLDGGHLMYYAIEAVRGKPLGHDAQDIGFKVGIAVVLTLMIVATWNDLARLFSS